VKWKRLIGKITSRYGGILFPVPSSFWFAWKRREPGILPDPTDGKEGDRALQGSLGKREAPSQWPGSRIRPDAAPVSSALAVVRT
jgi:hypothetical protein